MTKSLSRTDRTRRWGWSYKIRKLRTAYDAARAPIDDELRYVQSYSDEHQKNRPKLSDPEYEGWDAYDDHLADQWAEGQESLRLIREGFALILYHSWERHAVRWTDFKGGFNMGKITPLLRNINYIIDPDLHRLSRVASTIKHNSAELWRQNPEMFKEGFDLTISDEGYANYDDGLELKDADLDAFFTSLETSGPDADPLFAL